ncbi:MAG: alcohol dehydrogenase [Myxococcota bacterium]
MKALVFNGPRDIRYETYPDPKLGSDNSVILKVEQCSICGSDLHMYHGENIGSANYGDDVEKFCVGHEFTGEVVEVGRDVHRFRVGERVLSAGGTGCGNCAHCLSGRASRCRMKTAFGLAPHLNGGQAEFVNVPNADQILHTIPDGVSDEQAMLLTDAMATAYFGLSRTAIEPGDAVAVVGLGPIGLIGVELALLLGASQVFAIDPVLERRVHAESLGARALSPDTARQEIAEATNRRGVKRVFEASGASPAIELALKIAARGGTASFIGLPQPGVVLPMNTVLFKDITIRAGIASVTAQWSSLIPLLQQGRLKTAGLFTHHMALADGAEAYRLFDAREDGVVKIMMSV